MRPVLSAALLVLLAAPARGGDITDFTGKASGTTGSDFLLFDIGARAIALGGAYTAVTDDAYSLYWNPAGLTRIPRFSAGLMYSKYVEDISYQSASLAQRVNDSSVIAAGWRYRDIGSIDHTDISGNALGTFRPRDYVAEIGWGQSIYELSDSEADITMGVVARWIHSDYLLHADGYGGDLGIQSRFYNTRWPLDAGFAVQNMGRGQKFDKERDTLPFRMRFGGAVYPARSLMISADAIMPIGHYPHGALGAEYSMEIERGVKAALRAGFNSLTVESLGLASTLSAGMGLAVGNLSFDYAFSPFGVLGDALHRFSIGYNLPARKSQRYRER